MILICENEITQVIDDGDCYRIIMMEKDEIVEYDFEKIHPQEMMWVVYRIRDNMFDNKMDEFLFSFDKKKILDFYLDYPQNFTEEQIMIFKKERPMLAELKPNK